MQVSCTTPDQPSARPSGVTLCLNVGAAVAAQGRTRSNTDYETLSGSFCNATRYALFIEHINNKVQMIVWEVDLSHVTQAAQDKLQTKPTALCSVHTDRTHLAKRSRMLPTFSYLTAVRSNRKLKFLCTSYPLISI